MKNITVPAFLTFMSIGNVVCMDNIQQNTHSDILPLSVTNVNEMEDNKSLRNMLMDKNKINDKLIKQNRLLAKDNKNLQEKLSILTEQLKTQVEENLNLITENKMLTEKNKDNDTAMSVLTEEVKPLVNQLNQVREELKSLNKLNSNTLIEEKQDKEDIKKDLSSPRKRKIQETKVSKVSKAKVSIGTDKKNKNSSSKIKNRARLPYTQYFSLSTMAGITPDENRYNEEYNDVFVEMKEKLMSLTLEKKINNLADYIENQRNEKSELLSDKMNSLNKLLARLRVVQNLKDKEFSCDDAYLSAFNGGFAEVYKGEVFKRDIFTKKTLWNLFSNCQIKKRQVVKLNK